MNTAGNTVSEIDPVGGDAGSKRFRELGEVV